MATVTRTSIPKPDVRVTITPRTVTPTQVLPGLPTVVIGPCYQVLDPQLSTGLAENPDAMITLPAMIRSHGNASGSLAITAGTVTLKTNVNGVAVSSTFGTADSPLTVEKIVAKMNDNLRAAGAAALAEVVGTGSEKRFVLRTTSKGAGQVIYWDIDVSGGPSVSAVEELLKLPEIWKATGFSGYDQRRMIFQFEEYPDPRGIIDELVIDTDTVRLFAGLSSGLSEWHRTKTIERCGTATIQYISDGDNDGYTNLVRFTAAGATPSDIIDPSPGSPTDIELCRFNLSPANPRASFNTGTHVYGKIGTLVAGDITIEINGFEPQVISVLATDNAASLVAKINAVFPNIASVAGAPPNEFIELDLADLNGTILPNQDMFGRESYIRIAGPASTLQSIWDSFGAGVTSRLVRGKWRDVRAGDELYVNGSFLGKVIEVATDWSVPGSEWGQLKLDREFPEETSAVSGRKFYLVSVDLPSGFSGSSTVPLPDVYVADTSASEPNGTVQIKSELLRDAVTGAPQRIPITTSSAACNVYMGYTGLRLDVSPRAAQPDLVQYGSAVDLASELSPVDTTNPLALGIYFAMLNSPGITTYGLGISEVSTAEPDGTLDAYTEAAEFLESKEVYSIVPLTHSEDVAKMFQIHVDAMSDPGMKSERISWFCPAYPTRERSTLAASGAKGNCSAITGSSGTFHTALPDLPARLLAAGISVTGVPDDDMVYLQVRAFGSKMFAITAVSGPDITIQDYSPTASPPLPFETDISLSFTTSLVDEPFTIAKLGGSLYDSSGVYNKQKAAEALYDLGQEFADRRVRMVIPDEVVATIGGIEQVIPGYYACCCLAGMKAANNPSQGFTNMVVAGINNVQKTSGFFKESQLNLIAGGGGWILIPGPGGGGVVTRMSLTTDTSSIEYRQDSWTSALDYGAKYIRTMLRRVIGPTNITQAAIDLVASLVDGCLRYLVDAYIWTEGVLNSIVQSSAAPDTLEVGVSAKIPYNLNYIDVNIVV